MTSRGPFPPQAFPDSVIYISSKHELSKRGRIRGTKTNILWARRIATGTAG